MRYEPSTGNAAGSIVLDLGQVPPGIYRLPLLTATGNASRALIVK